MGIQLIGGDEFVESFTGFRSVAITGRLGSGKTLLSVALAKWLYDSRLVKGVMANFWIDPSFIPRCESVRNAAVILDEAWFMSGVDARTTSKQFSMYGAFGRKTDSFWLFPGIFAIDKRMRQITVYREWDLWLLGIWWFSWIDFLGSKGRFFMRGYEEVFGKFNTRYIPLNDGGIRDSLIQEIGGEDARKLLLSTRWKK